MLAIRPIALNIACRDSRGAGVQRTAGLVGFGWSAAAAAVEECADFAGARHVPEVAGAPIDDYFGGDAAFQVCASAGDAGEAEA